MFSTHFRTAGFTDRIPLPIKKYDNFKDLDSSTDDDNDSGADWHSSHSAHSSVVSCSVNVFRGRISNGITVEMF